MGLLMLSSPPKFNADYLFGPSRPYVSPRPDGGRRICTPPVPPPRAGRPVRADTTSGEDGINNNNNKCMNKKRDATTRNPVYSGPKGGPRACGARTRV
jgi:hypothetical protein